MDTALEAQPARRADRIPDRLHRHPQDRGQRPAGDGLLPGLRLGRGNTSRSRRSRPRSTSPRWRAPRLRVFVLRGDGTPRRLDRGRGRPGRAQGRRPASHHPVPGDRLRSRAFPRARQGRRSSRRATASSSPPKARATRKEKFLSDMGTRDAFGHVQLGGVAPTLAQMVKQAHGYKYHWALRRLPAALRAPKRRLEGGRRPGLCRRPRRGRARACGQECRDAGHPPQILEGRIAGTSARWASRPSQTAKKWCRANFITTDGFGITAAGRRYLEPLIAGEDNPPYKNGIPAYATLKNARVRRRLSTTFVI